jgi:hypothetical protein
MGLSISKLFGRSSETERMTGNGVSHVHVMPTRRQRAYRARYVVTSAESAPCTCPDFCERDHGND